MNGLVNSWLSPPFISLPFSIFSIPSDIGLLVYYDNSNYYDLDLDTQRKMLIDDLKFYGFEIDYSTFGLDKLRTLYYGKEMYSENQNG